MMKKYMVLLILIGLIGIGYNNAFAGEFDVDTDVLIGEFALGFLGGTVAGIGSYAYAAEKYGIKARRGGGALSKYFASAAGMAFFSVGEVLGSTAGVLAGAYIMGFKPDSWSRAALRCFTFSILGTLIGDGIALYVVGEAEKGTPRYYLLVTTFILPTIGAMAGYHYDELKEWWENSKTANTTKQSTFSNVKFTIPIMTLRF